MRSGVFFRSRSARPGAPAVLPDLLRALTLAAALLAWSGAVRAERVETDSAALRQLLDQGVVLVDVRTPAEWRQTGVIEGSRLLTFFDENGQYDAAAWLDRLGEIVTPEQPVALICATGGRTRPISHFLDEQVGYRRVYNVTDGIRAWINDGGGTVAPAAP